MHNEAERKEFSHALKGLLKSYGENPEREGLQQTPERYLKFLDEFLNPAPFNMTTFKNEGYDEMIIETEIPFHSLCEHHMLPFFGTGTIAYIPGKKIVGLSKIARTLETFSRRLQNQERITNDVADFLMKELEPLGVAVSLSARHFCMEMRGVKKHNTVTHTTAVRGDFKTDARTREEFLKMAQAR